MAAELVPERIWAWTAAPSATTSSGLSSVWSGLPLKSVETRVRTAGMRVEPPTITIWSIWEGSRPGVAEGLANRCCGAGDDGGDEFVELGVRVISRA